MHTARYSPHQADAVFARYLGFPMLLLAAVLLSMSQTRTGVEIPKLQAAQSSNPMRCLIAKGQPTPRLKITPEGSSPAMESWAHGLNTGSGPVVRIVIDGAGEAEIVTPKAWSPKRQHLIRACLAYTWLDHQRGLRQSRLGWQMATSNHGSTGSLPALGRSALLVLFVIMAVTAGLAGATVHSRRMAGRFEVFALTSEHRWMIVMLPVIGAWLPIWAASGFMLIMDHGLLAAWLATPIVMLVSVSWSSALSVLFKHVYGRRFAAFLMAPLSMLIVIQSRGWLLAEDLTIGAALLWHLLGLAALAALLIAFFEWRCGWRGEGLCHVV